MQLKKMSFKKILWFNFEIIKTSILLNLFLVISSIVQPIIFLILNILKMDISNYLLIINLVPLIFYFFFVGIIVFKLYSETKRNSLESICRIKPIRVSILYLSRFIIVSCYLLVPILFSCILNTIILIIFNVSQYLGYIWISNLFITFIIGVLFASIAILIATFSKPNYYFLAIIPTIFGFTTTSLITRPFQNNNKVNVDYDVSNPYIFTKLYNNDKTYYAVSGSWNEDYNPNINPAKLVNDSNWYNYLIGSEWTNALYQSLYLNLNLGSTETTNEEPYSYNQYRLIDVNFESIKNSKTVFAYRPTDINLLELTNNEGSKILFDDLVNLVTYSKILNTPNLLNDFYQTIQTNKNWSSIQNNEYLELLKRFYGLDFKYPNLFYLFKYNEIYNIQFSNLSLMLEKKFSSEMIELLKFIYSSPIANLNLLNGSQNILNTNLPLESFYPNVYIYSDYAPISNIDKYILSDILIKFVNNQPVVLIETNSNINPYSYQKITIEDLQKIDSSIIDEKSYKEYIDLISLRLDNSRKFVLTLKQILPQLNIYNIQFNKNQLSLSKFNFIYTIENTSYLKFSSVIIFLYLLFFFIMTYLSLYTYKKSNIH